MINPVSAWRGFAEEQWLKKDKNNLQKYLLARLAPILPSLNSSAWIVAIFTLIQFAWLAMRIAPKIAWVNLLPTLMLFSAWVLFINIYFSNIRRHRIFLLLPALILALRIPITISRELEVVNPLMICLMAGLILRKINPLFRVGNRTALVLTVTMLLFSAGSHLGLDSPYTYTFRTVNGMPSEYSGFDDNKTWECAYENPSYVVHCDARHFIASEKIFTEPNFDPSYSVVLQRFLFGYFDSLIGMEPHRWLTSVGLNLLFWLFSCISVYKISLFIKADTTQAGLSMLCCASAWGFIDMVAQPAPYMLSFAYAPIILWATLELTEASVSIRKVLLMSLIITSVVMVYDAYQLILASVILLLVNRKFFLAIAIFSGQLLIAMIWRLVSMRMVLGTEGDLASPASGISNFSLDFRTWWHLLSTINVPDLIQLVLTGMQAYLYGNLVIGAVAAGIYVLLFWERKTKEGAVRRFLAVLLCINIPVLLAIIFVTPQMHYWSPGTGMQPRLAFFSYPINMIALVYISAPWLKKCAVLIPALLFLIANIDLTGLASIPVLFDYGAVGLFWK